VEVIVMRPVATGRAGAELSLVERR
jgi:hypothetical protein